MAIALKSFPTFQQSNISKFTNELNLPLPLNWQIYRKAVRRPPEQILMIHTISADLAVQAFKYLFF